MQIILKKKKKRNYFLNIPYKYMEKRTHRLRIQIYEEVHRSEG